MSRRFFKTLCILDGPSLWRERAVRYHGSTMDDVRTPDGAWVIYDRARGYIDSIKLMETGLFVVGSGGIMFGATEIDRRRYDGIL